MESLKKEDRRKIKPKFIGSKEQKAKGQGRLVMINVAESSLDILRSKKVLNNVQYYTALKLRRLWEKSRIGSYTSNAFHLLYKICIEDHTIKEASAIYQVDRVYLGKRLREAIEELKKFLDQSYD